MSEIQPLSPSYPIVKPVKIKKDENSQKKPPPHNKPSPDEQDSEPLKHIDEQV
ncbi:MAG: hypothetical protein HOP23_02135 [Methylococcaceae bacterium]|nr:hypothetical protein [Methylococcaceae bacterium]